MLETVTLAAELGVDVNGANTDGRTALDAAKSLQFDRVIAFLIEKGARTGKSK
jgi:ankyrin repeat protein